jgi:hypothetical protein
MILRPFHVIVNIDVFIYYPNTSLMYYHNGLILSGRPGYSGQHYRRQKRKRTLSKEDNGLAKLRLKPTKAPQHRVFFPDLVSASREDHVDPHG